MIQLAFVAAFLTKLANGEIYIDLLETKTLFYELSVKWLIWPIYNGAKKLENH